MSPSFVGRKSTLAVPVTEASQVANARRNAAVVAEQLAFDETQSGRLAIVVTEAATNLLKHGAGGVILLQPTVGNGVAGVDVLALDRGAGITNVADALRDGYSTAGSPGTGLGAIRRLAAHFDIHSSPGGGTAVLARLWAKGGTPPRHAAFEIATVCLPAEGEDACGDAWAVHQEPRRVLLMLVDGLGHGVIAAAAANEAVRVFEAHPSLAPAALLDRVHGALKATRGAAVGIAEIDVARAVVKFAGVGNIAAVILAPAGARHLVSHNGTVGHALRKLDEFTYPWPADGLFIAHSDGLSGRWDLGAYAGLASRHPALVAGVLLRDFRRRRDDVSVIAARGTTS